MSQSQSISQSQTHPVLAPPVLRAIGLPVSAAAAGAIALTLGAFWWMGGFDGPLGRHMPSSPDDLDYTLITTIAPSNAPAMRAAIDNLRLDPVERARIEQDVLQGRRRLGWIVLTDSMDPDGDVVSIEAGGTVQHVPLSKAWIPVAVPLGSEGSVAVTGIHDGGGGITVAVATRGGPMPLKILAPGERILVIAP